MWRRRQKQLEPYLGFDAEVSVAQLLMRGDALIGPAYGREASGPPGVARMLFY